MHIHKSVLQDMLSTSDVFDAFMALQECYHWTLELNRCITMSTTRVMIF